MEAEPPRRCRDAFMVIVKASEDTEAGRLPSREELAAMGRSNEELGRAGVMLAGSGTRPGGRRACPSASPAQRPYASTASLIPLAKTSFEIRGYQTSPVSRRSPRSRLGDPLETRLDGEPLRGVGERHRPRRGTTSRRPWAASAASTDSH